MAKHGRLNRPVRSLKPRLHIFCEGEKTEPNYFRHYLQLKGGMGTLRDPVVIIEDSKKTTPIQLVEEAIKKQASYPDCDKVWVVYDRESPTKYEDGLHNDARQKAEGKVSIALSNVCFEVWLLLHFQKTVAPYTSCDDLLKKSELKRRHIRDYDKGSKVAFAEPQIADARKNAQTMNKATMEGADRSWKYPYQWNPYTNVHEVLDEIDRFMRPS